MSLILVTHDTDEPALYGGIAAAVACRLGAGFAHLPAQLDTMRFADAVQHVTADGALVEADCSGGNASRAGPWRARRRSTRSWPKRR